MSVSELQAIPDFKIWNAFGKIEFTGMTDITGVNLDLDVVIKERLAEVYPEDVYGGENNHAKPAQGQKLNKEARITLYNIEKPDEKTLDVFVSGIKKMLAKQEAGYHHYDEKGQTLHFIVPHWTKYEFTDDLSEDDQDSYSRPDCPPPTNPDLPIFEARVPEQIDNTNELNNTLFTDQNFNPNDNTDQNALQINESNPQIEREQKTLMMRLNDGQGVQVRRLNAEKSRCNPNQNKHPGQGQKSKYSHQRSKKNNVRENGSEDFYGFSEKDEFKAKLSLLKNIENLSAAWNDMRETDNFLREGLCGSGKIEGEGLGNGDGDLGVVPLHVGDARLESLVMGVN